MSARPRKPSLLERKISEATEILRAIDFPIGRDEFKTKLKQGRVSMILLAVADLAPDTPWSMAKSHDQGAQHAPKTKDIIRFLNRHYGTTISEGSYDNIRRKNLDYLVQAGLVVRSAQREGANTNDGTRGYAISKDAQQLLQHYGGKHWADAVAEFRKSHRSLTEALYRTARKEMVNVRFPDGAMMDLSPGPHNRIQKAVIEEFLPCFLKQPRILYMGDTAKKSLVMDHAGLEGLNLHINEHDILPDIIAVDEKQKWLFLIEAVHSSNPVSRIRHLALEDLVSKCPFGTVFVSAFEDLTAFAKWAPKISWETEIWVASDPSHMIHYNGDRFYGPRDKTV